MSLLVIVKIMEKSQSTSRDEIQSFMVQRKYIANLKNDYDLIICIACNHLYAQRTCLSGFLEILIYFYW